MKKLLFIAAVLMSSFAFTACEEEIIAPASTTESGGDGTKQTDSGQWD
ncbi:MAG: hypothetical protein ACNS60_04400 [Candidatus Cyclobacteriaceae bacterium M2_1C_046]